MTANQISETIKRAVLDFCSYDNPQSASVAR